jgi:hypothetical protein
LPAACAFRVVQVTVDVRRHGAHLEAERHQQRHRDERRQVGIVGLGQLGAQRERGLVGGGAEQRQQQVLVHGAGSGSDCGHWAPGAARPS